VVIDGQIYSHQSSTSTQSIRLPFHHNSLAAKKNENTLQLKRKCFLSIFGPESGAASDPDPESLLNYLRHEHNRIFQQGQGDKLSQYLLSFEPFVNNSVADPKLFVQIHTGTYPTGTF